MSINFLHQVQTDQQQQNKHKIIIVFGFTIQYQNHYVL